MENSLFKKVTSCNPVTLPKNGYIEDVFLRLLKILQKICFQKQVPWESSPKFVRDIVGFDELKNNFYSPWFHQKVYDFLVGDLRGNRR